MHNFCQGHAKPIARERNRKTSPMSLSGLRNKPAPGFECDKSPIDYNKETILFKVKLNVNLVKVAGF